MGKRLAVAVLAVGTMAALMFAQGKKQEAPTASKMADAAVNFLGTLTEEQKSQATFSFDDKERLNWHFIPRERKGLPLKAIEGAPLKAALTLIQSGLSEAGYDQAVNVMSLEEVLYLLEGGEREYRRSRRDPQKYYISVFGTPSKTGRWGWRVEGHHLSLNYTLDGGKVVSATPEFFGANPGFIDAGPKREIRVLGPEEDLARQVLKLCTPAQQAKAWIAKEAPDEIRAAGVAQPVVTKAVGLPISEMSDDQKQLMRDLLSEYLKNMPSAVEEARRKRINDAGLDNISFAWWGSSERNERHHYRVQGPTFLIEYNNTQNDANHVHSVWRNIDGDFDVARKQ